VVSLPSVYALKILLNSSLFRLLLTVYVFKNRGPAFVSEAPRAVFFFLMTVLGAVAGGLDLRNGSFLWALCSALKLTSRVSTLDATTLL